MRAKNDANVSASASTSPPANGGIAHESASGTCGIVDDFRQVVGRGYAIGVHAHRQRLAGVF
jgi:hypothetical protein